MAVHVVSHDALPLQRVLGDALGAFVRDLHEQHGVVFHMQCSISAIGLQAVRLDDGTDIEADLVVLGIGVRPRVALAEAAGLAVDNGVLVDAHLETSVPGIYAAGDVARWHAPGGGDRYRVEHWVVAERHGQVVAENMLGAGLAYRDTPFFWSAHYDVTIRYAGHGAGHDAIEVDGDIAGRDFLATYRRDGDVVAVAAVGRDAQVLEFSARSEQASS